MRKIHLIVIGLLRLIVIKNGAVFGQADADLRVRPVPGQNAVVVDDPRCPPVKRLPFAVNLSFVPSFLPVFRPVVPFR